MAIDTETLHSTPSGVPGKTDAVVTNETVYYANNSDDRALMQRALRLVCERVQENTISVIKLVQNAQALAARIGPSRRLDYILTLEKKARVAHHAIENAFGSKDTAQVKRALLLYEESILEQEIAAIDMQQMPLHRRAHREPSTTDLCTMTCC
jgi:hypothetical protein